MWSSLGETSLTPFKKNSVIIFQLNTALASIYFNSMKTHLVLSEFFLQL